MDSNTYNGTYLAELIIKKDALEEKEKNRATYKQRAEGVQKTDITYIPWKILEEEAGNYHKHLWLLAYSNGKYLVSTGDKLLTIDDCCLNDYDQI